MSRNPPSPAAEPHDLRVSSTPGDALRSHSRRLRLYLAADPARMIRSAEAPEQRAHRSLGNRRKNRRTNPQAGTPQLDRRRRARVGLRRRTTNQGHARLVGVAGSAGGVCCCRTRQPTRRVSGGSDVGPVSAGSGGQVPTKSDANKKQICLCGSKFHISHFRKFCKVTG